MRAGNTFQNKLLKKRHLVSAIFGILLSILYVESASAEMLWEVHTYDDQAFENGDVMGYSSHCREGHVVSGSIALEEPYPATPTVFRSVRGFDVFENRKAASGRWDFFVGYEGPPTTVRVTVSITCYTGEVVEYFYDSVRPLTP